MRTKARVSAAVVLAALLLPAPGLAQDPAPAEPESSWTRNKERALTGLSVGFDALVLRPLGLVHLVLGGALFVPAAALSYFAEPDALKQAREVFIDVPFENLFQRPLGDL